MMTMMTSDTMWKDIEVDVSKIRYSQRLQRLIMKNSLFRIYIAVDGLNRCRMLLLEIPEQYQKLIEAFNEPQGFNVVIEKNGQEKDGFVTCIIESAAVSKNDIFSVVANDVLLSLSGVERENLYAENIYKRLEKWRDFFKNRKGNLLCEEQIVGLFGELELLRILLEKGITSAQSIWNGPMEAAQDFQSEKIAVEVKTTCATVPDCITISSLAQLDIENREHLFLVVYKIDKVSQFGLTLPEMISKVSTLLTPIEQNDFMAKLFCLGYCEDSSQSYKERYSFRGSWHYDIKDNFPRITKENIAPGIFTCKYGLHLDTCATYQTTLDTIISELEDNHG